ncbi:MAG: putative transporter ATP-binding protein [Chloroflexi bacterium]|nr:putative transporter ATP-binding protein [Chloroflexota bacterium]
MLNVSEIYKLFEKKQALAGVSFDVHSGEVMAILGPSGCGKSTLLSIIAGLEEADHGEIAWDGVSLSGIPAYRRGFGLMFQDFALFPHLNVFDNVAFGLRMQHHSVEEIPAQVRQALELAGLPGFEMRDVNTLSGGEQQRVALARALAPRPRLLMLDEPLGALDRNLREHLALDLRDILRRSRQTAIYVTHDQEEAFTLADRLVVMSTGKIEQIGTPDQVYSRPASLFAARFLGFTNLLPGTVISIQPADAIIETALGRLCVPLSEDSFEPGQAVTVLLRPDSVTQGADGIVQMQGTLAEAVFRGSITRTTVVVQGVSLSFDFPSHWTLPAIGQAIHLSFEPSQALQLFSEAYS